jgi:N-acetylmuramoyl-L-alanine amidase
MYGPSNSAEAEKVVRKGVLKGAQKVLLVVMLIIFLAILYQSCRACRSFNNARAQTTPIAAGPWTGLASTPGKPPRPTSTPIPLPGTPTVPPPKRIGIVAGHYMHDSGALCPDGLREVDVNLSVAQRVVAILRRKGYEVELLGEFDEALSGYQADVFVSLHSDSCDVPGASGFKVTHVAHSAIPEEEDRLVECLSQEYAEATGLTFHANSITEHMTYYHAFRKIALDTPGAIIEMGFMLDDRYTLLNRQHLVARGIVNGIVCFLEGSERSTDSSTD